VPISIKIFSFVQRKKLIFIIVMETIAANLGSMMTPIGNPQNLYIYSFYRLHIVSFFKYIIPAGVIGYIIITGIVLISQNGSIETAFKQKAEAGNITKPLLFYAGLFLLCVLTILHFVDYRICIVLVSIAIFIVDKKLFKKVDYSLLLTFVCFFVFVGNLERISLVKEALSHFLKGRVFIVSILSSQIISNVPAAMMISRFTSDVRPLLLGVNIGGLGTPVASLASLISFRIYSRIEESAPGKFLRVFAIYNISILLLVSVIFYTK
ncbi:MAG: SLC13 family permease, partial [Treponema sp.]|nr:SLC13 family permease [Treponema sp.]